MHTEETTASADDAAHWRTSAFGVVILGMLLRFYALGFQNLWNDELATVRITSDGPLLAIERAATNYTSGPLYYILQSILLKVLPINEITMRLLPAIFGSLSVWLVYLIGARLFSRKIGVFASSMFALSLTALHFAQEARTYSLAGFLVLAVVLTLLRLVESPTWDRYLVHGLTLLLVAYSHPSGIIATAGVVLFVLISPRLLKRLGWEYAATLGGAVAGSVPWLVVVWLHMGVVARSTELNDWAIKLPQGLSSTLVRTLGGYIPWGEKNSVLTTVFLALVFFGAFGLDRPADRDEPVEEDAARLNYSERARLLVCWAGMVCVGGLIISRFVLPIFSWRLVIGAAPALYLLASYGLTKLWKPAAALIVAAGLIFAAVGLPRYYTVPNKELWREAARYLLAHDAERDGIIASPPWMLTNVSLYAKILGHGDGLAGTTIPRTLNERGLAEALDEALAGKQSTYFVLGHLKKIKGRQTAIDLAMERQHPEWRLVEQGYYRGDVYVKHYVRR